MFQRFSLRAFLLVFTGLILSVAIVMGGHRQSKRLQKSTMNIAPAMKEVHEQKSFVIVICSYNNADYVTDNLTSALAQVYPKYRIIYIDDASTDDTYAQAKAIKDEFDHTNRITLIHNSSNQGAMANTFSAVHMCSNDEIVVILDGDDRLNGPNVLKRLNMYYNNPQVWMTYGQCMEVPANVKGMGKPMSLYLLKARAYSS